MYAVLKELTQLAVMFTTLAIPSSSSAAERPNTIDYQTNVAVYKADITKENVKRIEELYQEKPFSTLEITSSGGEFDAGMELGTFVYKNHIKVHVPKFCASSCTFAFFMTKPNMRSMNDDAIIAIHNISFTSNLSGDKRMYISVDEVTKFAEDASTKAAIMYSLYASVGIPPRIMLKSARLRGDSAIVISKTDLIEWGTLR